MKPKRTIWQDKTLNGPSRNAFGKNSLIITEVADPEDQRSAGRYIDQHASSKEDAATLKEMLGID
jgi:hypothetical protein